MIGKIKFIAKEKGFGFVTTEGSDVFFHVSKFDTEDLFLQLEKGDSISFEVAPGKKGTEAVSISFIPNK